MGVRRVKVFLCAVVAAIVIAAASQVVLTHTVGQSSEQAYSESSARP